MLPDAERDNGLDHQFVLGLRHRLAICLLHGVLRPDDMAAGVELLVETHARARRVFGPHAPVFQALDEDLREIGLHQAEDRARRERPDDASLRFRKGTRVECSCGPEGWLPGEARTGAELWMSPRRASRTFTRIGAELGRALDERRELSSAQVVAQWYSQPDFPPDFIAPYQILLDVGRLIFAPEDDDQCIRAERDESTVADSAAEKSE